MGLESIKNMGRFGDTELAHVTPGEVVLPPNFLNENPKLKQAIEKILDKDDTSIAELMVGDNMNSINPSTGLPEFFLKKLGKKIGKFWNKKVKPVVNKVAKVAKFVPGPWQLPAQMYDTGRVAVNVIKGDQDPLALLRNLGQAYAFTNIGIKDGELVNPSDKFSTDAIGGRTRDFFRSKFGGEQTASGSQSASEIAQAQGYEQVPGVPNSFIKDGTVVTGEQLMNSAAQSPGFFDSTKNFFSGLDGQPGFGFGDILAGGGKFFDFLGSAREGIMGKTGLDPALLALATAYGKATEEAAKKEVGGAKDVRLIRPELQMPQPFSQGFDLGLVKNPVNAFADGGAVIGESDYAKGGEVLDMRKGGESVGPGTGTSDDIPAMLSDGEFVMTAKANLGAGAMKINKKKGGIMEMVPSLEPDRKRGADNMMKLMRYFEGVA
jgi:hypothetical protein|tara:strand:+ start:6558 stop:7862 length:1305 start_codon:yes stop_codon:yes gene_type:complete